MLAFLTGESEYCPLEFVMPSELILEFYLHSELIEVDLIDRRRQASEGSDEKGAGATAPSRGRRNFQQKNVRDRIPQMSDFKHIIQEAEKLNHQVEIISNIKSGKEAVVYKALLDGEVVAMKLYKDPEERNFKNVDDYLAGKHYRTSSHKRAVEKNNTFAKRLKHDNWVKREFFMLQALFQKGACIPRPILQIDDALFMEFLGNEDEIAPRLSDIKLTPAEAQKIFDSIIENIKILSDAGVVHANLSEYNILYWNSKAYIIDFPQSIDVRNQECSKEFLERDLRNIINFFKKYIEIDSAKIHAIFE